MARGFKIADAYVEITADKDGLRQSVRGIPAAVGGDADRAGRDLGERLTRGIEQKLDALSGKVVKTRQAQAKAADAVKLAEVRLNEVRAKEVAGSSRLLAAEQRLEQARRRQLDLSRDLEQHTRTRQKLENQLSDSLRKAAANAGPDAERGGGVVGDKLAMGMRLAIIRNSPLIAAAIGAALMAGAPAVLAASTLLFAGVGIAAAAQSDKVQAAWLGAWHHIRDGAIQDAGVLEDTLVGLSARTTASFDRMRPALRNIFADLGPQIEVVTGGLLGLVENALPGFERAIARNMPVVEGLADFLERLGAGTTRFLDNLSDHAPAAGEAFSLIGQTIEELLPTLGELLGQGAELATIVLPPLVSVLSTLNSVVESLGPALPLVATGLLGMKVANAATGWIGGLSGTLGKLAAQGGLAAGAAGKLAPALSSVASAAGPIGAAIGFGVAALVAWHQAGKAAEDVSYALGRAMQVGGSQASAAGEYLARFDGINRALDSGIGQSIGSISLLGYSLSDLIPDTEQARQSYESWYQALDPAAKATEDLKVAQDALGQVLRDNPDDAAAVAAAGRDVAAAQAEVERTANQEEAAIRAVTSAMVEQWQQAMAGIDSGFAYRNALDQLEDSQKALNEAMKSGSAEDQRRAFLDLEEQSYAVAQAYGQQQADLSGLSKDSTEYAEVAASEMLTKLYELRDAAGPKMAAAIQQQINQLEAAGVSLDKTGDKTEAVKGKMVDLGKQRPTPKADLDHGPFDKGAAGVDKRIAGLDAKKPTPTARMDDGPFSGILSRVNSRIGTLARQRPTPSARLNDGPFSGIFSRVMARIGQVARQRPTPTASVNDRASGPLVGIKRRIDALYSKSVTITTHHMDVRTTKYQVIGSSIRSTVATGGSIPRAAGGPVRAATGRVVGPGGPKDDLVAAVGPNGEAYALSAGEEIVNAGAVDVLERRFGAAVMPLIQQGRLPVPAAPPPVPVRSMGLAGANNMATPAPLPGVTTPGGTSQPGSGLGGVRIDHLEVVFQGTGMDLTDRRGLRRAAVALREELIKLEREQS